METDRQVPAVGSELNQTPVRQVAGRDQAVVLEAAEERRSLVKGPLGPVARPTSLPEPREPGVLEACPSVARRGPGARTHGKHHDG